MFTSSFKSFIEDKKPIILFFESVDHIKDDKEYYEDIFFYNEYCWIPRMVKFKFNKKKYRGCLLFKSYSNDKITYSGIPSTSPISKKKFKFLIKKNKNERIGIHDSIYCGIMVLPHFNSEKKFAKLKMNYAKIKLKEDKNWNSLC